MARMTKAAREAEAKAAEEREAAVKAEVDAVGWEAALRKREKHEAEWSELFDKAVRGRDNAERRVERYADALRQNQADKLTIARLRKP